MIATAYASFGQLNKKNYTRKKLSRTDVGMVFSYYNQNNDHSAVTGGTGTEDLQVYVTHLALDNVRDSVRTVHFDMGFDVISSASTDNIDFVVSSASKVDARVYTSLGYERPLHDRKATWGMNTSFSIESDYLSWGQMFSLSHINEAQTQELTASLQMYFDDLRWGRYQFDGTRELVYPVELRNTKWFDRYRRNSFNLALGLLQTINRRMSLGVYPGLTYQAGLLSTPFHRVYFIDDTERVENLPDSRWKIPIGAQLNSFLGPRWVLRANYRFYWDDFGITAHTFGLEAPVKVSRAIALTPFVRLYHQRGTDYFKPYARHSPLQEFYTSDYDLSKFSSGATGLGFRYAPYAHKRRSTFKALELRYSHYERSDGMVANTLTLFVNYDKGQKPPP